MIRNAPGLHRKRGGCMSGEGDSFGIQPDMFEGEKT